MNEFMLKEVWRTFSGDLIGSGCAREVYTCAIDPTLVIKVETGSQSFQNVAEWTFWSSIQFMDWARDCFAPCVAISPCGSVLVQRRTTRPLAFPDWVPTLWTDLKQENYGMHEGRLVCHDYGLVYLPHVGLPDKMRVKRARWWSTQDGHVEQSFS